MFKSSEAEAAFESFHRHHPKLKLSCKKVASRRDAHEWGDADHWRCTLSNGKRRMVVTYSMGSGHGGRKPSLQDVLMSCALDTSGYQNARGFHDWCSEYGYDTDDKHAKATYKAVEKQAAALNKLVGHEGVEQLIELSHEW